MSKIVLVTGGARGIGLGIVHAFAAAGHRVMIADLGHTDADWNYNLADADQVEAALKKEAAVGEVDACEVDVTNFESCQKAVAATVERFGGLDILVNNAGGSGGFAPVSKSLCSLRAVDPENLVIFCRFPDLGKSGRSRPHWISLIRILN